MGVAVFFHGGGFVAGGLDDAAPHATAIAMRLGLVVVAPAYTLASERPFPAAAEDAYAAVSWAANVDRDWGAKRLVVVGEEAGGNLAAVAAMMARDRGGAQVAAQVLVAPMLDPTLTSPSMQHVSAARAWRSQACYRAYLPNATDRLHPYAAPAMCSRLAGLAPTLIVTVDDDPLRDEAECYGAKLIAAGVTTQVERLPGVATGRETWSDDVWTAIAAFVWPRIARGKR
jgi:acetyl esterase/lipase